MGSSVLDQPPSRLLSKDPGFFSRHLRKRQNIRVVLYLMLVLCDVAAIRTAFILGASLRGAYWLAPQGIELVWFVVPIHALAALRAGAYGHDALRSRLESIGRACSSFMIATALICMLLFFQGSGPQVSRLAFGLSLVVSLVLIALFRAVFLTVFVGRDFTWTIGELLIIDDAAVPKGFAGDVLDAKARGFRPDLNAPEQLSQLAEIVNQYDRVVVSCSDEQRRSEWAQLLKCYHVTGEVLLDGGSPLGAIAVDRFRGSDTVVVARGAMSLGNRIKKRTMDVVVSLVALVILLPLFVFVAILIKLDSKGPVFFAQPRVGRGNRMFKILKFRSMRQDATDVAGDRSTTRGDDRVTRVGRIIRATSIDELPQLVNVLIGDMSVVGPRPHALGSLAGDKLFWEVDRAYWRRHTLKPGITGLAQVRGFRGATHEQTDLQNRLQSDLEYISGWSLWRDVKILILTIRVVIHSRAY